MANHTGQLSSEMQRWLRDNACRPSEAMQQLWETTMDPETRILKKIEIKDAALADEVFSTLMGEEVPPRKRFIQTHAKQAEVDI